MGSVIQLQEITPATYSELAGIIVRGYVMRWLAFRSPMWLLMLVRQPIHLGIRCITACSLLAEMWSALFFVMFGLRSIGWGWEPLMLNYPNVYGGLSKVVSMDLLSVALTVIGILQFSAAWSGRIRFRRYLSFAAFNVWLLLCVMFFRGIDALPPLVAISFPPAAIISFLCYVALSAREELGDGRVP